MSEAFGLKKFLKKAAILAPLVGGVVEGGIPTIVKADFIPRQSVCIAEGATSYPLDIDGTTYPIPLSTKSGIAEKRSMQLGEGWTAEYHKEADGHESIMVKRGIRQFDVQIERDCNLTS